MDGTESILDAILAERRHQQDKWGDSHDDGHNPYDLVEMAICYATKDSALRAKLWPCTEDPPRHTADNVEKRLIQSAALLVAELERMQRTPDA